MSKDIEHNFARPDTGQTENVGADKKSPNLSLSSCDNINCDTGPRLDLTSMFRYCSLHFVV